MKLNAKQLREKARCALKGIYWWAVLACLIAAIFGAVYLGSTATHTLKDPNKSISGNMSVLTSTEQLKIFAFVFGTLLAILMVIGLLMLLVASSVEIGYKRFNLALYSEKKPSLDYLFSYSKSIWKALGLNCLIVLKVLLWSLLFVVPGIIAAYRYSMAHYIFAENPTLSANECIKKSCEMMKGEKWNLFCLELSFIGWGILAVLCLGIGILLLTPYEEAAKAAFYLNRTGRLDSEEKKETE